MVFPLVTTLLSLFRKLIIPPLTPSNQIPIIRRKQLTSTLLKSIKIRDSPKAHKSIPRSQQIWLIIMPIVIQNILYRSLFSSFSPECISIMLKVTESLWLRTSRLRDQITTTDLIDQSPMICLIYLIKSTFSPPKLITI